MSTDKPWTIERIHSALGNPELGQRFLGEINRVPAADLLAVFARWERIAKDTTAAVARGRDLAGHDECGEQAPGEWIDATQRVADAAAVNRSRRVA